MEDNGSGITLCSERDVHATTFSERVRRAVEKWEGRSMNHSDQTEPVTTLLFTKGDVYGVLQPVEQSTTMLTTKGDVYGSLPPVDQPTSDSPATTEETTSPKTAPTVGPLGTPEPTRQRCKTIEKSVCLPEESISEGATGKKRRRKSKKQGRCEQTPKVHPSEDRPGTGNYRMGRDSIVSFSNENRVHTSASNIEQEKMQSMARANYERFFCLARGSSSNAMVEHSSAGILGWATYEPKVGDVFGDLCHFPKTLPRNEKKVVRKFGEPQVAAEDTGRVDMGRTADSVSVGEVVSMAPGSGAIREHETDSGHCESKLRGEDCKAANRHGREPTYLTSLPATRVIENPIDLVKWATEEGRQ